MRFTNFADSSFPGPPAGGWQKKSMTTGIPKKTIDKAKYTREWRKRNPGKAKEHVQRYWMKRLQAAGDLSL